MMKQLITVGPRKTKVVDAPIPTPNDDQMLIKVKYCGICMAKLNGFNQYR